MFISEAVTAEDFRKEVVKELRDQAESHNKDAARSKLLKDKTKHEFTARQINTIATFFESIEFRPGFSAALAKRRAEAAARLHSATESQT